jgi:hypothetical protein
MQATGWVAIYAAVVSTGSLGWQVWTHQRAKRPQVTVILDTWRTYQVPGRRLLEEATVRVRNREDFAITVDKVYLGYPGQFLPSVLPGLLLPSVPGVIDGGDVSEVPFDVPSREVVSFKVRPAKDYKVPPASGGEFVPGVAIELRTGERYGSKSTWRSS